ncbi:hypothetical protein IQ260_04735 [Leptolyngbya cf. ectocarpi LEGE 11479]|uniref:Uncharacterized protein n=1 Tax=Leptolyngbya cf. ectocarpi LEGE 11479 TaxID=1828722 RepID=A0A928ZQY8_LEPEC|nr:hypothetical protein [Leptolyngbya ectocarpi]MBE9065953.1 hypothetical protein [Leptolyngbya cf. ectocarpi LEGE 11479]
MLCSFTQVNTNMTRFSLKRTLQFNLASTIEVLNHINHDLLTSNLHTPLRYSEVLLSIGKITNICHQNIHLKKVYCNEAVTYISAIALKLQKNWQRPVGEIASILSAMLHEQTSHPIWACIRKNDAGWLEFVIARDGIERWQQSLYQGTLPIRHGVCHLTSEALWQLQSGYELCCRWQACHQQLGSPINQSIIHSASAPYLIPCSSLKELIDCLLDICDMWDEAELPRLLEQSQRLVLALEICAGKIRPDAIEAEAVKRWFKVVELVLKQLLNKRLSYPLTSRF